MHEHCKVLGRGEVQQVLSCPDRRVLKRLAASGERCRTDVGLQVALAAVVRRCRCHDASQLVVPRKRDHDRICVKSARWAFKRSRQSFEGGAVSQEPLCNTRLNSRRTKSGLHLSTDERRCCAVSVALIDARRQTGATTAPPAQRASSYSRRPTAAAGALTLVAPTRPTWYRTSCIASR